MTDVADGSTPDLRSAARLRAETRAADGDPGEPPSVPELSAFRSTRRSLWGTGAALRIVVPGPWPDHVGVVAETLDAIDVDDDVREPGTGPVAFGALPFDRDRPATLVVPQVLHARSADGSRWTTTVAPVEAGATASGGADSGHSTGERRDRPAQPPHPRELRLRATSSEADWCAAVERATARIAAGELTKVVLARELSIDTDVPLDPGRMLRRLRHRHPAAMCFAIDGVVGASPELLVSRVGDVVRARPMAGTAARTGDPDADQRRAAELLGSAKNRAEHRITIDMVHDTLLGWSSFLDIEPEPSVVAAGPVQHLATMVEGRLSHPAAPVIELVAGLHPTPAVGGWPRADAIRLIEQLEPTDRGRYAGPVGWTDAAGNGAWAVGIRSVELAGTTARLFAGVGVVADSDPAAELAEARAKAEAMLASIVSL